MNSESERPRTSSRLWVCTASVETQASKSRGKFPKGSFTAASCRHVERVGAVDAFVPNSVAGVGAGQGTQRHHPSHEAEISVRFAGPDQLVHLVVDSTGLKIFGEGEWLAQKHKIKGIRRRWRKLHLGLDLASGAIVCADLTHDEVGDSTALPGLLDQLDAPVAGFLADGAYDGASIRDMLRRRYGETLDVVIPPPKNAVIRPQSARDPTVRDRHIAQIRSNGRMAWQVATGYNQRSRIETQIGRWKSVIGPKLKSRSFSRQITEIQVGQKVLNTMTALGRPVFERIA